MAATGTATPIPIFDPVFNPPELADDELVLVEDVLALVGSCTELADVICPLGTCVELADCIAELADDELVLVEDVLALVGSCTELADVICPLGTCVELADCIAEPVVVGGSEVEDAIEVAIGMGI